MVPTTHFSDAKRPAANHLRPARQSWFRCPFPLPCLPTLILTVLLSTSGCAVHGPYQARTSVATGHAPVPANWSQTGGAANSGAASGSPLAANSDPHWWHPLSDPALPALLSAAQNNHPNVQQALARVAETRALLAGSRAATLPALRLGATASQSKGSNTTIRSELESASLSATLSWEADLFGRIGHGVAAAQAMLAAREQDAVYAKLILETDIASALLNYRACQHTVRLLQQEVASRQASLQAVERKLAVGLSNQIEPARSRSGWLSSRANQTAQQEQCERLVNALSALTGQTRMVLGEQIGHPIWHPIGQPIGQPVRQADAVGTAKAIEQAASPSSPAPGQSDPASPASTFALPPLVPDLPASLLAQHPSLIAAEREAQAAWQEIGAAKAARWPRLDLSAMLGQQWLRFGGINSQLTPWSLAANLGVNLFDGGAGAANVSQREARYQLAVINVERVLRNLVQEMENALAFDSSARERLALTSEAEQAARITFTAADAQWQAGAVSLLELEDARRNWFSAQNQAINARRDLALAWVALVKASATRVGHAAAPAASPTRAAVSPPLALSLSKD